MSGDRRILVIPAYNEAASIERLIAGIAQLELGLEIVVVDDGSRDATGALAAAAGAHVLRHPFNLGYGAALQTGYKYAHRAGASLVVQMDADLQHDPRDIPALQAPIERGELDLVIGSRFAEATGYRMGLARAAGRRLFQLLLRAFGLHISDPTSGYQALSHAILDLYVRDFFPSDYPDVDVLLAAHRHGMRIGEHPVTMAAAARQSSLHHGLTPIYYVYKMLLSLWALSAPGRPPR